MIPLLVMFQFPSVPCPISPSSVIFLCVCSQSSSHSLLFPVSNQVSCCQYLVTSAPYMRSSVSTDSADHFVSSKPSLSSLWFFSFVSLWCLPFCFHLNSWNVPSNNMYYHNFHWIASFSSLHLTLLTTATIWICKYLKNLIEINVHCKSESDINFF